MESSSRLIFPGSTRVVRGSDIAYTPASGLTAIEVQGAIDEIHQNQNTHVENLTTLINQNASGLAVAQIDILALKDLAALLDPWSNTYTYSTNELVAYNGQIYKSLQDNNLDNNPLLSPTYWYRILRGDELDGIQVELDGIASGQILTYNGTQIGYKSQIASDVAITPIVGLSGANVQDGLQNIFTFAEANSETIDILSADSKQGPTKPLLFAWNSYQTTDFIEDESQYLLINQTIKDTSELVLRFQHSSLTALETFLTDIEISLNTVDATEDFILNGGMETGDPPDNWTALNSTTLTRSTNSYEGTYSLRIDSTTSTNSQLVEQVLIADIVASRPELLGQTIRLSFASKKVSGTGNIRCIIDDGNSTTITLLNTESSWNVSITDHVISSSATYLKIRFETELPPPSSVIVEVDSITLFKVVQVDFIASEIYDFVNHEPKVIDISSLNWNSQYPLLLIISPESSLSNVTVNPWLDPYEVINKTLDDKIDYVGDVLDDHIISSAAHEASAISIDPISGLTAVNVQEVISVLTTSIGIEGFYNESLSLDGSFEQTITHNLNVDTIFVYAIVDDGVNNDYYISPHFEKIDSNNTKIKFDKAYTGTVYLFNAQKGAGLKGEKGDKGDPLWPQSITISTQSQFETYFGSSWDDTDAEWYSSTGTITIPANTTIFLSPIDPADTANINTADQYTAGKAANGANTYNGLPAYILRNKVYLSNNVKILGSNQDTTTIIKNDGDDTNEEDIKFYATHRGQDSGVGTSGSTFTNVTAFTPIPGDYVISNATNVKDMLYKVIGVSGTTVTVDRPAVAGGSPLLSLATSNIKMEGWAFDGRGGVNGLGGAIFSYDGPTSGGGFLCNYTTHVVFPKITNIHIFEYSGAAVYGNKTSFYLDIKNVEHCICEDQGVVNGCILSDITVRYSDGLVGVVVYCYYSNILGYYCNNVLAGSCFYSNIIGYHIDHMPNEGGVASECDYCVISAYYCKSVLGSAAIWCDNCTFHELIGCSANTANYLYGCNNAIILGKIDDAGITPDGSDDIINAFGSKFAGVFNHQGTYRNYVDWCTTDLPNA